MSQFQRGLAIAAMGLATAAGGAYGIEKAERFEAWEADRCAKLYDSPQEIKDCRGEGTNLQALAGVALTLGGGVLILGGITAAIAPPSRRE